MRAQIDSIRAKFVSSQAFQTAVFSSAAILVGVAAVYYSKVFAWAEEFAHALLARDRFFFLSVAPLFIAASSMLCRFLAPGASGGGPEHVADALRTIQTPEFEVSSLKQKLGTRVSVIKVISSLLATCGGGALGREGPVIQITAGIFLSLGRKLHRHLPDIDLQTWIVAGSAAGLAAAFNTPLAGIVFAIEELSEFHFARIRVATLAGVVVAGLTAQVFAGSYLLFGYPTVDWSVRRDIFAMLLVAVICGGLVALFQRVSFFLKLKMDGVGRHDRFLVWVGLTGLLVGLIALAGGLDSINGGIDLVRKLTFDRNAQEVGPLQVVARYVNVLLIYVAGCAGGLLAPSLALGAGIAHAVQRLLPEANHNLLILTGMAAYLGSMIKAPFTASVLILEMTDRPILAFPLLMATLTAHLIAQGLGRSARPDPSVEHLGRHVSDRHKHS